MPLLVLDGQPTDIAAFSAYADERAEKVGLYRLELLALSGTVERCWARCTDVQCYDRVRAIACGAPMLSLLGAVH